MGYHIVRTTQAKWKDHFPSIEFDVSMPRHWLQCKLISHTEKKAQVSCHFSKHNLILLFFFSSILQTSPLYPSEIIQLRGTLDPQVCPHNSELIAYIYSGDLWVINTISGHCKRLTKAHDENKSFSDNPLSAGVPSYVMQEEFSRYQGYWWQTRPAHGTYMNHIYLEIELMLIDIMVRIHSNTNSPGLVMEYK